MKTTVKKRLVGFYVADNVCDAIMEAGEGNRSAGLARIVAEWQGKQWDDSPVKEPKAFTVKGAHGPGSSMTFYVDAPDHDTLKTAGRGHQSAGLRVVCAAWRKANRGKVEPVAAPTDDELRVAAFAREARGLPSRFPGETMYHYEGRLAASMVKREWRYGKYVEPGSADAE